MSIKHFCEITEQIPNWKKYNMYVYAIVCEGNQHKTAGLKSHMIKKINIFKTRKVNLESHIEAITQEMAVSGELGCR